MRVPRAALRDISVDLDQKYSFPAGAVTFAVVHREFTEQAIVKYEGRPGVAELLKKIREDGYYDKGVSLYVNDSNSGRDYLRFDCFEREPHYHYHHLHDLQAAGEEINLSYQSISGHAESVVMNGYWHQVPFDSAANGEIRAWALDTMRVRLRHMLREAGAGWLAERVEDGAAIAALGELEPYLYATPTLGEMSGP